MIGMLEVIYTKLNVRYVGRSIKIDLIIVGAAFVILYAVVLGGGVELLKKASDLV